MQVYEIQLVRQVMLICKLEKNVFKQGVGDANKYGHIPLFFPLSQQRVVAAHDLLGRSTFGDTLVRVGEDAGILFVYLSGSLFRHCSFLPITIIATKTLQNVAALCYTSGYSHQKYH